MPHGHGNIPFLSGHLAGAAGDFEIKIPQVLVKHRCKRHKWSTR
jgi:hypothetical protein